MVCAVCLSIFFSLSYGPPGGYTPLFKYCANRIQNIYSHEFVQTFILWYLILKRADDWHQIGTILDSLLTQTSVYPNMAKFSPIRNLTRSDLVAPYGHHSFGKWLFSYFGTQSLPKLVSFYWQVHIHCPTILWNRPQQCVHFVVIKHCNFFRTLSSCSKFKHIEKLLVYMNCLKIGMTKYCFKKLAPFKHNKTNAMKKWFDIIGGQCINEHILRKFNLKFNIFRGKIESNPQ